MLINIKYGQIFSGLFIVCNFEIIFFLIIHRYDIYFNRAAPTLVSAATSATLAPSASPMGSVKAFILAGLLRVITATCTVQCVLYSTVQYSHGHLALALVVEADEAAGGGAASRLETSGWEAGGQEPPAAHPNVHICYPGNTITAHWSLLSASNHNGR